MIDKNFIKGRNSQLDTTTGQGSIYFVLLLPFVVPESLYHIPGFGLSGVLLVLKAIAAIVVAFLFLKNGIIDKWFVLITAYCFVPVLSTFLSNNSIFECFRVVLPIFVLSLLVLTSIRARSFVSLCRLLSIYFLIVIFVNFLTVILFPSGLYATESDLINPYNWFLGFDNIHVLTFLLAGVVSLVFDYAKNNLKRLSFVTCAIMILGTLTVFIRFSATSIVVMLLFDIAVLLRKMIGKLKPPHFGAVAIVLVGVSVALFTGFLLDVAVEFANTFFGSENKSKAVLDRFAIWQKTISAISDNGAWIFGLGVQGSEATIGQISITHAHNQLLEELYVGGIVELFLLLTMLVLVFKKLAKCQNLLSVVVGASVLVLMTRWLVESVNMDLQIMIFTMAFYIDAVSAEARSLYEKTKSKVANWKFSKYVNGHSEN